MTDYEIGVIGGSGLYGMDGLEVHEERRVETPFGDPSDPYVLGELEGRKVAFLARHGKGHRISPTELNFRANVFGFKVLGCREIISVSAVGSMKEEYAPTHMVVPDQFFDRTRHRVDTFFGDGLVAHVSLADPLCPSVARRIGDAADADATTHRGGTYLRKRVRPWRIIRTCAASRRCRRESPNSTSATVTVDRKTKSSPQ